MRYKVKGRQGKRSRGKSPPTKVRKAKRARARDKERWSARQKEASTAALSELCEGYPSACRLISLKPLTAVPQHPDGYPSDAPPLSSRPATTYSSLRLTQEQAKRSSISQHAEASGLKELTANSKLLSEPTLQALSHPRAYTAASTPLRTAQCLDRCTSPLSRDSPAPCGSSPSYHSG